MAPGGRPSTPTAAQPLGLPPGLSGRGLGDGDHAASQDVVQSVRRDAALAAEANGSLPPGPSFDGPVSVVNSSCQFGGNTFYHGPVTVVLPDCRADADLVVTDTTAPTAAAASTSASASGEERVAASQGGSATAPKDGAKASSVWRSPWQRVALLAGGLVLVLAVCLTSAFFVVRAARRDADHVATEPPASDKSGTTPDQGDGGLLVARSGWGAIPPKSTAVPLRRPINRVIIHHTATAACTQASLCQDSVRSIQIIHMYTNNWEDIGYNFLVGGDGRAYEGRGWDAQGAHTTAWNAVTLGVALIGNFCTASLPARQLDALVRLLQQGEEQGALSPDYILVGKCQMNGGGISPGRLAMKSIMGLSHWNSSSVDTCRSC